MIWRFVLVSYLLNYALTAQPEKLSHFCNKYNGVSFDEINWQEFSKLIIPRLEGTVKGDLGTIGIIGGSTEYSGAPLLAAIAALKAGADVVYVITTESAAPIIKSYSPDLIVFPYLHTKLLAKLVYPIADMDVVVIGPGWGREEETLELFYEIIHICKKIGKPLVIDGDGLYAISRNSVVIEEYPIPGAILTPGHKEADKLDLSISAGSKNPSWALNWGDYVSVLTKGREDTFYSTVPSFGWRLKKGGSPRRVGGQGEILAGALATFYHWGIKANVCSNAHSIQLAQSFAAAAAANLTRMCNALAYRTYGRSMTASDMLRVIYKAFKILMAQIRNQ
ncbi:carbohydrate kinase domain-containing protein [Phthorimaea operculella]|nr:carbohydrate kinase domain-containing protein [Phthorimaea operculella]